jgi:hypothetical protein
MVAELGVELLQHGVVQLQQGAPRLPLVAIEELMLSS